MTRVLFWQFTGVAVIIHVEAPRHVQWEAI
jgi:hypothetical protein